MTVRSTRFGASQDSFLGWLFLACVFLLALAKIQDYDAFLHLVQGRLIWEQRGLPAFETTIYTMQGMPYLYSSWFFGLLLYAVYQGVGVYGVILFKAFTIVAVFSILLKDSLRSHGSKVVAVIVLLIMVLLMRGRFVERPDIFFFLFLSFSIFALNRFVEENSRLLYALPVLHMIWANSHSSVALMFVPFLSVLAGGAILRYFRDSGRSKMQAPSWDQLRKVLIVFAASLAATFISPYGLGQYTYGAQFLRSQQLTQLIIELQPPTWAAHKAYFLVMIATFASFAVNYRRFSLIHFILFLQMVVVSLTAMRFIFPFFVVAGPLLARNISETMDGRGWGTLMRTRGAAAVAAFCIVGSTSLTLAEVKPFGDKDQMFGFGINDAFLPEGALKYMDRRGITGRVFNTFEWGQYIVWRDFPKRTPFVDGRVYLPPDIMTIWLQATQQPASMEYLYRRFGFDALLLKMTKDNSPEPPGLYVPARGAAAPLWALVYWDDASVLYLRRGGRYDAVIGQDEYTLVHPARNIEEVIPYLADAAFREGLLRELRRNVNDTASSLGYAYLGFVYNESGMYRQAIEASRNVKETVHSNMLPMAYNDIAYAYSNLGDHDASITYSKKSLAIREDGDVYYRLALAYLAKDDPQHAVRYLEAAIKAGGAPSSASLFLANAYERLGRKEQAAKAMERYRNAISGGRGR